MVGWELATPLKKPNIHTRLISGRNLFALQEESIYKGDIFDCVKNSDLCLARLTFYILDPCQEPLQVAVISCHVNLCMDISYFYMQLY